MRRMSATELVCAAPSQQRLRRSSVAAALRAASAPSQQHQLRRGRDAQNERDGAGLRISVAAATPSQLRRSSAARTMSGRRGSRKSLSSPLGKFAKNRGTPHKPCDFNIILPKELRPLPCQGITGPGGWPRTVGHDLKFESTGGKMMLAPHSARRVETRRAE